MAAGISDKLYSDIIVVNKEEWSMTKRMRQLPGLIICLFLVIVGCSSSDSGGGGSVEPRENQDSAGVWLGYIDEALVIGIITDDHDARFIGQDAFDQFNQFMSPAGEPLVLTPPVVFSGDLDLCTWDTTGPDPVEYGMSLRPGDLFTTVATRFMLNLPIPFGGGAYYRFDDAPSGEPPLFFWCIYNTMYHKVSPDVNNLGGQWQMHRVFSADNTLILTITPTSASRANVSGADGRGNSFNGTITIHYNDDGTTTDKNVYDVNLSLHDHGGEVELLEGLATYVSQMNTQGIEIPSKTLVIGVTNSSRTRSLSGFAVEADD